MDRVMGCWKSLILAFAGHGLKAYDQTSTLPLRL